MLLLINNDDIVHLGTWLKQRQQEQKEEQKEHLKEENISIERSAQNSSGKSSDSSSITNEGVVETSPMNLLPTYRRYTRHRPYSATLRAQHLLPDKSSLIKEITHRRHPWDSDEYVFQQDSTEPLTKSALIYRLMRSRLEANLAKSISASRNRSNQKKKFSSSTAS